MRHGVAASKPISNKSSSELAFGNFKAFHIHEPLIGRRTSHDLAEARHGGDNSFCTPAARACHTVRRAREQLVELPEPPNTNNVATPPPPTPPACLETFRPLKPLKPLKPVAIAGAGGLRTLRCTGTWKEQVWRSRPIDPTSSPRCEPLAAVSPGKKRLPRPLHWPLTPLSQFRAPSPHKLQRASAVSIDASHDDLGRT